MNENMQYAPFGIKDKVAYMFGDLANDMTFILQSSFLMIFYTQVLKIAPASVGTLFLVARLVDAFTDTGMGRIVDSVAVGKEGKFKPWIRRMAIPVALASFLLYQSSLQHASMTVRMIYMYVTYLLWGSFCYTAINIPYGSMASAISPNPDDRTQLSTWRSRGATLASLAIGFVVPYIIYTKVDGVQVVKTDLTFPIMAAVFSILAIVFYYFCYKGTVERVKIPSAGKQSVSDLLASYAKVLKNRSLIGIIFASLFLIMGQLMLMSMNAYVLPQYYNSASGLSLVNAINPLLSLLLVQVTAPYIVKMIGKRELGILGCGFGAASLFTLYMLKPENMYVYILMSAISYIGLAYFNTVIWANIIDVIDDIEVKTYERSDGTVYGLYSFARKIGQAFAGAGSAWALGFIGFDQHAKVQTAKVLDGMFAAGTLIPAIAMTLSALAMILIYPLSKKVVDANSHELDKRRQEAAK